MPQQQQPHYPDFDVLHQEEHWDDHTREIVHKRLDTAKFYPYRFFTPQEADTLARICAILLGDDRLPVITYVVHHFDTTLKASLGESQRKDGVPDQAVLIRDGLALLDDVSRERYGGDYLSLEEQVQTHIIESLFQNGLSLASGQRTVPAKNFIDKLHLDAVSAYYSHPAVWSEIGYAGPAYPRGYVRSEYGLTDPWEARRNGQ